MKTKNSVYIKATSSTSCAGNSDNELYNNLLNGKSGLSLDNSYYPNLSATIGHIKSDKSFIDLLIENVKNIQDSIKKDFSDTLLIVGSSVGGMTKSEEIFFATNSYKDIDPALHNIDSISYILKKHFSFYSDISFSTACTSSANAIGYAYEVVSKGVYKSALVVGVDELSKTTVGGFASLGVLSTNNCRPFDIDRDGMNVSEAIACLYIDSQKTDAIAKICGVGYSSDAHHITQPHPDGNGAIKAMQDSLKCANIGSFDIDYINAHGTGTQANDSSEAKAIEHIFANNTPTSSTKSITGHTLGGAGALEAIVCTQAIKNSIVFKNNFLENRENSNIYLPTENISKEIKYTMSNSFAFGGNNTSIIIGKI